MMTLKSTVYRVLEHLKDDKVVEVKSKPGLPRSQRATKSIRKKLITLKSGQDCSPNTNHENCEE